MGNLQAVPVDVRSFAVALFLQNLWSLPTRIDRSQAAGDIADGILHDLGQIEVTDLHKQVST